MPDSFEHMPPVAIRIPNGALASLAGNVDRHHRVSIADLILVQGQVGPTIARLMQERQPDVVGLSIMTFQRATAMKVAALVHRLRPGTRIVAGGYDPSLAPEAYDPCTPIEFLVRGEGELTFRELLRAIESGGRSGHDRRPLVPVRRRVRAQPQSSCRVAQVGGPPAARSQRARAGGLHRARPQGRRRGNVAGLHVRLQLLLDHRDARPELSPVSDRTRARGHRRLAQPRRARDLPGRRQHHARRETVRGALRGDHRRRH